MVEDLDVAEDREIGGDFCATVIEQSGQPVSSCYHCQRCGGGCPVVEAAGVTPNQFLRILQMGLVEEALESPLLWLCVGCSTCGVRCPNRISTDQVIDQLRSMATDRRKIDAGGKDQRVFHDLFLKQVRRFGRLHELSLLLGLKWRTRTFFKDMDLGRKMFLKGKISLLPEKIGGIQEVKRLFKKRERP